MKFAIHLSFVVTFLGSLDATEDTLIAVSLLFRHGDRCPDHNNFYKSSPYYNESYFKPYGFGQLTNKGKLTMYNLGKEIRQMYDGFLDASYHVDLIEAVSSDFNRTKASLQLFLAGLFPPTKDLVWLEGFNWQPIPYTYRPLSMDEDLYGFGCKNWMVYINQYLKSPEASKLPKKYEGLYRYLTKHTGEVYDNIVKTFFLYFGFQILEELNFKLPEWANSIYPETLHNVFLDHNYMITGTPQLRQILGGYLLKHVIDIAEKKIEGRIPSKKMFVWSAHENNILGLLKIMKSNRTYESISYGSYIGWELHKVNNVYGFKVFFKNNNSRPTPLDIPGCKDFCPLEDFKRIVKEDIPESIYVCRGIKSSSMRLLPSVCNILILCFFTLKKFI